MRSAPVQGDRGGVEEHVKSAVKPFQDKYRIGTPQKGDGISLPPLSDKKAKKKKGKKKDPNAPKRPKSSYMFFANSRRPKLKAAHPDWPFGNSERPSERNGLP